MKEPTKSCVLSAVPMPSQAAVPSIIIAGKEPPPVGGQNLLVAELLRDLRADGRCRVDHLDFAFTKDWSKARKFTLGKLATLWHVRQSMRGLARANRADLLLYPAGGPQTVPLLRDALLLPMLRPFCRRLVMHFHAAGYAKTAPELVFPAREIVRRAYSCIDAAIVMTEFGREDPLAAHIPEIHVCPNMLRDTFAAAKTGGRNGSPRARILYLGHVYEEKGVADLLEALRTLDTASYELRIVGDCLTPWTPEELRARIDAAGLSLSVVYAGTVDEAGRDDELARADFLVFPSRAHESFGLVLAEAMMWSLPVVTFDWRGNKEVVGPNPGGWLLPGKDRIRELREAIMGMLGQRTSWQEWGERNRQRFLEKFSKPAANSPLVQLLLGLAAR